MIRLMKGDILQAQVEAIVNTVNCVGVMGRGIALQVKKAFPENYNAYLAACERGDVRPGKMFVFDAGPLGWPRYIINFPTKRHWRNKSRIEDIEAGLVSLIEEIQARNINSVAIPPLGSGLGGLDWNEVRPLIESALEVLPHVDILLFEPSTTQTPRYIDQSKIPAITPGRAALVGLIDRYLRALLDPTVTLLEVHKLMYFLQVAGEPLRLRYVKAPYGPYAENLRHVLRAVEGYLIMGYADGGDAPDKPLTLIPGATQDAEIFLIKHTDTRERFERVVRLVEGFETSFGLELLATVHWLVEKEQVRFSEDLVKAVYDWAPRKRRFTPSQVGIAYERLSSEGWI